MHGWCFFTPCIAGDERPLASCRRIAIQERLGETEHRDYAFVLPLDEFFIRVRRAFPLSDIGAIQTRWSNDNCFSFS